MPPATIKTSERFNRAARAERDRLRRTRSQLASKREDLQGRLDALDAEMEAVDGQLRLLEGIAEAERPAVRIHEVPPADGGSDLLGGASIREVAVPLLLRRHGSAPIHYRDWYALFLAEGYAAAGKRPDAVFLNQVSRSPLVRSSTRSGFYFVDPTVVGDLRESLGRRQGELAELLAHVPDDARSLEAHRLRQGELGSEIARIERHLAEAVAALERAAAEQDIPAIRVA